MSILVLVSIVLTYIFFLHVMRYYKHVFCCLCCVGSWHTYAVKRCGILFLCILPISIHIFPLCWKLLWAFFFLFVLCLLVQIFLFCIVKHYKHSFSLYCVVRHHTNLYNEALQGIMNILLRENLILLLLNPRIRALIILL